MEYCPSVYTVVVGVSFTYILAGWCQSHKCRKLTVDIIQNRPRGVLTTYIYGLANKCSHRHLWNRVFCNDLYLWIGK